MSYCELQVYSHSSQQNVQEQQKGKRFRGVQESGTSKAGL